MDVEVFWSGLLHHQPGAHYRLSHQEARRGLSGQMEIKVSRLICNILIAISDKSCNKIDHAHLHDFGFDQCLTKH